MLQEGKYLLIKFYQIIFKILLLGKSVPYGELNDVP